MSRREINTSGGAPTLENILPELRSQILSNVQDLRTLRSLVRASPAYHE